MKKIIHGSILAFVTFISSYLVYAGLLSIFSKATFSGTMTQAAAVGLSLTLPLLTAFITMHISALSNKRMKIRIPRFASVLSVAVILFSFAAGFAGQILYSLKTEDTEPDISTVDINSDIVIMLDDSGSMYIDPDTANITRSAAISFVDSLPSSSRCGAGIFSHRVGEFQDLVQLDIQGKNTIKDFFSNAYLGGATDFDSALIAAYDCLMNHKDENTNKAVIFITDGDALISDSTKSKYLDNGIKLYSIRISSSQTLADDLVEFAENTGGSDFLIDSDSGTIADEKQLTDAFTTITTEVEIEKTIESTNGLIIYDEDISFYKVIIRFITILLIVILAQLLYFGHISALSGVGVLISAVGATASMTVAPLIPSLWISSFIVAALMYTVFASLDTESESENNV